MSQILPVLYDIVESVTPNYESTTAFNRWTSLDDLSLADPSGSWRSFRVVVVSTGKGTLQSSSSLRSKTGRLTISLNYPKGYFADDDVDFLGIENIRADDDMLIVNKLCFERPNTLLESLDQVRSIRWLGSGVQGRLWVISLELEWLEEVS